VASTGDAAAAVGAIDAAAVPDRPAAMNSRRENELPDMRSLGGTLVGQVEVFGWVRLSRIKCHRIG